MAALSRRRSIYPVPCVQLFDRAPLAKDRHGSRCHMPLKCYREATLPPRFADFPTLLLGSL